jgi:uncharacterized delta-60 repeat protein
MKTKPIIVSVLVSLLCSGGASFAINSLDATFNPGSGANNFVETTLVQPDGKILMCGTFTEVNGVSRGYIARLNPNGSVDTSFEAHPNYWVRHMALQSDGKIVIGGFFTSVEGVSRNRVARLNADGSLDTTFNTGTGCAGKIVPADPTDPFVFAVAVQADGRIVIGGNFTTYNGAAHSGVVRLNSNGSADSTFDVGSGVDSWVRTIALLPNGQVMLGGWFTSYDGQGFNRMVRLNANGTADTTFNPFFGDKTAIYTIARLGDGKYIVAGHSVNPDAPFKQEIVRLNHDGSFDTTFNSGGAGADEKVESVVLQPDGKIVMVGYFGRYNGVERRSIARLNADGSLDSTLIATSDNWLWTAALQSDGKILVCGGLSSINGISRNGIARLNASGTPSYLAEQAATGSLAAWYMNQTNLANAVTLLNGQSVDTAWRFAGAADFNDDGKHDFVWQHTDNRIAFWLMNGRTFTGYVPLYAAPPGWRLTGLGDLNRDNQQDLLLRHTDGRLAVWFMRATNVSGWAFLNSGRAVNTSWQVVGAKDMNSDGHADIVWHNTGRQTGVSFLNGTTTIGWSYVLEGQAGPVGWHVAAVGDLSGDGKADLIWQRTDGAIAVWFLSGTRVTGSAFFPTQPPNQNWKLVGLADFDLNGKNDFVWRYSP